MIEFSGNEHEREKETVGNKCHKEKLGLTPTYYVKTGFLYVPAQCCLKLYEVAFEFLFKDKFKISQEFF